MSQSAADMRTARQEARRLRRVRVFGLHGSLLVWPVLFLIALFLTPLLLLIRTSFARADPAVFQGTGFSTDAFTQLFQPLILQSLGFSILLALIVSTVTICVALPAAYLVSRLGRQGQTWWLIAILSTLALSEVLIAFSWQVLLSRRAGLSNLLVFVGYMDAPTSLSPHMGAVVACMVYFVFPFTFLTLFPALSRLDRSLFEAAQTMGARPLRAFFDIYVYMLKPQIGASIAITSVITLGAFVPPLVLGRPTHWTIGVVINEVALRGQNLPFASAIAILVIFLSLAIISGISRLART